LDQEETLSLAVGSLASERPELEGRLTPLITELDATVRELRQLIFSS
jgi:hypothetical protein